MADWFKFYNDGLDAGGMQYCISEQPLVTSVWLVILSEASKNRSGSFPWDNKDFRLLGFARKINVSPGIFNQCVNLLAHAGYITINSEEMVIPGWDRLQSDYAKGLDKGYYKKTSKRLASVSEVSTVRREEKRVEESNRKVTSLPRVKFKVPSMDEIKLQASKIGLSDIEADKFFNYYESNGWKVGRNPMKSWVHAMTNWKNNAYGNQNSRPNPRNAGLFPGTVEEGSANAVAIVAKQKMARQMAQTPPPPPGFE